ncbi:MAG: hypothetical protein JO270_18500 [Acidobacteriaceae bacterium]|nr:hypothetical protein [Acidobacteriaceae bacterium]
MRRQLPPHYELRTRPDGLHEIDLPSALGPADVNAWTLSNIATYRGHFIAATETATVQTSLDNFAARFDDAFVANVSSALLWFSGKDLLAGLRGWLADRDVENAGAFRALLRDWIIAHPERALELFPEWRGVRDVVRA